MKLTTKLKRKVGTRAFISSEAFQPLSFIASFETFIGSYVEEKEKELLSKCCKRCQRKLKGINK